MAEPVLTTGGGPSRRHFLSWPLSWPLSIPLSLPSSLPRLLPLSQPLALGLSGTVLGGCALDIDHDHTGADAPSSAALPRQPRTAWVFSSGGPRGFVHVGVLKALHELGHTPDLIVGASAGALLGVLRAAGLTGPELEKMALDLQPLTLARLAGWGRASPERFSGSAVAELVREQLRLRGLSGRLEDLPVMTVCVARLANQNTAVAFNRGDAGLAVQAASAIPGQFVPVRIRGQLHDDADSLLPLPVRLARQLGASQVLAVDASAHEDRAPAAALQRYRAGDLRKRALTRPDAQSADLLLHPDFGYWVNLSQEFRERAILAGYRETLAAAARIQALHAS